MFISSSITSSKARGIVEATALGGRAKRGAPGAAPGAFCSLSSFAIVGDWNLFLCSRFLVVKACPPERHRNRKRMDLKLFIVNRENLCSIVCFVNQIPKEQYSSCWSIRSIKLRQHCQDHELDIQRRGMEARKKVLQNGKRWEASAPPGWRRTKESDYLLL